MLTKHAQLMMMRHASIWLQRMSASRVRRGAMHAHAEHLPQLACLLLTSA